LGVFGCVPAFDRYFKLGLGITTFGLRSVERVGRFYADNRAVLDPHAVHVLGFTTGMDTNRSVSEVEDHRHDLLRARTGTRGRRSPSAAVTSGAVIAGQRGVRDILSRPVDQIPGA
jgi:hypothetical protein